MPKPINLTRIDVTGATVTELSYLPDETCDDAVLNGVTVAQLFEDAAKRNAVVFIEPDGTVFTLDVRAVVHIELLEEDPNAVPA